METKDMDELQKTADYYAFRKSLKRKGIANIILGIIGIVFGLLYTVLWHPANVVLILIGIFILIVGIWSLIVPRLKSLLYSGVALCVVGAWNVVVSLINMVVLFTNFPYGSPWAPLGFIWAGIQLAWGTDAISRYRRLSAVSLEKPTNDMLKKLEGIINPVINSNAEKEKDIIQFRKQGGWAGSVWKGKLSRAHGILTSKGKGDIFFVRPEDFDITLRGRAGLSKFQKASFRIRGFNYKGTIEPAYMQRYESWKQST